MSFLFLERGRKQGFHRFHLFFLLTAFGSALFHLPGCAVIATRPVQEMSNTAAAMRAAREVQADTLSPDLYRRASEWFTRAKSEYKIKNFKSSQDYALRARLYAEEAEFEAIRKGGVRSELLANDSLTNEIPPPPPMEAGGPKFEPYAYPTPTGIPIETFEEQKQENQPASP